MPYNKRFQATGQSGASSVYDSGFGGPLWRAPEPGRYAAKAHVMFCHLMRSNDDKEELF